MTVGAHPAQWRWSIPLLLVALLNTLARAATDPEEAPWAVRFHLACAACHEGQCSGRLSLGTGAESVGQHIGRYAGTTDATAVHRLYGLLERLKIDCRPPSLPLPAGPWGHWEGTALLPYRDGACNGYFVPLGELAPGSYRLSLALAAAVTVGIEVISDLYEPLWQTHWVDPARELEQELRVEAGGPHFLRLRGLRPAPVVVEWLSITRLEGGNRDR